MDFMSKKITLIGLLLLMGVAVAFITADALVEYQSYCDNFRLSQEQEVNKLNNKVTLVLNSIQSLMYFTEKRIHVAQGDNKRLQHILISLAFLQEETIGIRKATYFRLHAPKVAITRFAISPIIKNKFLQKNKQKLHLSFNNAEIKGKYAINDENDNTKGILEIHFDASGLRRFLGDFQTIELFRKGIPSNYKYQRYIPIYLKNPDSFSNHFSNHLSRYTVFALYLFLISIFMILCIQWASRSLRHKFKEKIEGLDLHLAQSLSYSEQLSSKLQERELEQHNHQIACKSLKELQIRIKTQGIMRADHSILLINEFRRHLLTSESLLSEKEQMQILTTCHDHFENITQGIYYSEEKEIVDLQKIIQNVHNIFAEEIYRSKVDFKVNYNQTTLSFNGHYDLIELLLLNIIGKSLCRVQKSGIVVAAIQESENFIIVQVDDNGYIGTQVTERIIHNSFSFFIEDGDIKQFCEKLGFQYSHSRSVEGINHTYLKIPIHQEEERLNNNVIQLFK